MSDLFIPQKIKVGYQDRGGTYTGRLAYVIYYDNKGVLRKEKFWESWRDKKIAPEEFSNAPQDGFCLNKDVKRFNWSHFGSNRSYIRMYDPRGIEFEVTPENLIGILTETDCLKRGLEGKFVYAWKGTELVLLPCGSEEYEKAKQNTERQDQNISAKDLKPGCSYTTKKGKEVIYIGRFPWYEWNIYRSKPRKGTKQHIFANTDGGKHGGFFNKSDVKFLAHINNPDAVINYADLVDEWNKDVRSSTFEKWEYSPEDVTPEDVFGEVDQHGIQNIKYNGFVERRGNTLYFWSFRGQIPYQQKDIAYFMTDNGNLNIETMQYTYGGGSYSNSHYTAVPKEKILDRMAKSVKVKVVLSSGKKVNVNSVYDLSR